MRFLALLFVAMMVLPVPAGAACRLALAFALDVSGSVDDEEYRLQLSGLAAALGDPDVEAALFALPGTPVAMAVFEWSSSDYQRVIAEWTEIGAKEDLDALRARLLSAVREAAPEATGLGAALVFGKHLLDRGPACWDRTLDVSGDGKNNDWPAPERERALGRLGTIRINGLAIADDAGGDAGGDPIEAGELSAYYRARVIQGPDAFVEVALGFEDYAAAMRRKLLRELASRPVSGLEAPRGAAVVAARQ